MMSSLQSITPHGRHLWVGLMGHGCVKAVFATTAYAWSKRANRRDAVARYREEE